MKVVKPGTPLPPGIREKLEESQPPPRGARPSIRPAGMTVPFAAKPSSRPPSFGARPRSITPLGQKSLRPKGARYSSVPPPPSVSPVPLRPPSNVPTGFQSHGLDEVERALSVLGGRHPDAERVEREVRAEREWRQGQIAVEAKVRARQQRARRVVQVVFFLLSVLFAGLAFVAVDHYRIADAQMALLAQKYTRQGFTPWVTPSWPRGNRLEATLDQSACLVALGTGTSRASGAAASHLRIERAGDGAGAALVDEVSSSAAWCGCRGEHVTVVQSAPDEAMTRLLKIDPRSVGDHAGLEFLDPPAEKVLASRNHDCDVGVFGAWLSEGRDRHLEPRTREAYDAWAPRRDLEEAGFTYLASAHPDDHLLPLKASNERCTLVRSDEPGDTLSLRYGGEEPVRLSGQGAIAWCATAFPGGTVAREGHGTMMALDVDALRIGGGLGVTEWAARTHVAGAAGAVVSLTSWAPPGDLGWDAKNALLASGAPDALVTVGDGIAQHVGEARLVSIAIALQGGGGARPEGDDAVYGCVPTFGEPRVVCEQAGPLTWRVTGDPMRTAIAQAKLPFWLSAMNGLDTTRAQETAARLLAFARRLHALGYQATSSDGIEELPSGVQVRGVAGSDLVIAVGVGNEEPYVIPYTDAPPWTLDGTPRAVPLRQGQVIKLVSTTGRDLLPTNRRTVVFRHQLLL